MPEIEHYDAIVLGSGEAGKYMAWHLGSSGKRIAVIERKYIGGACPNIACLPSKNVIQSAKVASYFQRGEEFGMLTDKWTVSMPGVRARKRQMVDGLHQMHMENFARSKAEIVMGEGRFIGDRTLKVSLHGGGERILRGDQVFINTGTRAAIANIPGLAEASPLTHIEALELDIVPEHLLILGGGYVGLEFAQAMRRLGSHVTIMERNDRLLHRDDPDVSDAIDSTLSGRRHRHCGKYQPGARRRKIGPQGTAVWFQAPISNHRRRHPPAGSDGTRAEHSRHRARPGWSEDYETRLCRRE